MKHINRCLCLFVFLLAPCLLLAQPQEGKDRLELALTTRTAQGMENYLTAPDAYGTPLIIKLARQGDTQTLAGVTSYPSSGQFLTVKDKYGNNIFHVAKNADTVRTLGALIRHFYGAKAPKMIASLVEEKNQLGESPLHAQINAGHADTFRPLYAHTQLKQKNTAFQAQLSRLRGTSEDIFRQNQEIYCREIRTLSSANGRTLLEAAQAQIPYHAPMRALSNEIATRLPCLVNN